MKPENKMTAAVVVLGVVIVTAAAVVMNSPRWRQKAKEQHQESVLQGMTPDKAIALCGHPVLDETQTTQPTVRGAWSSGMTTPWPSSWIS